MRETERLNIVINGTEKNKSEIIYNNVVDNMNKMKLTKEQQIEYLKNKVAILENETKNKVSLWLTVFAGALGILLGLYFVAINLYWFGFILALGTFALMIYRIMLLFQTLATAKRDDNYDKIEHLREILNMRLK